jgi:hypothetical protein
MIPIRCKDNGDGDIMIRSEPGFQPERRFFIKKSIFGAAAVTICGYLPLSSIRNTFAAFNPDDLRFFDEDESVVLLSLTRSFLSGTNVSPDDINDVVLRLDRYFDNAYPEDQKEFRRLLVVFNNPVFVFLFSGYLKSFVSMSELQRNEYITGWMTSSWGFRRTAFQALKRLFMTMHYTRDASWNNIGYGGPLV